MEKIENLIVETFQHGEYIIEITDDGSFWYAWIYKPNYGTKMLMFGLLKEEYIYAKAVEIIAANVPDYIATYKDEYED